MDLQFRFRESALKHNITEADIRHAFEMCRYAGQYGSRENVYLLLGFDMEANPVEILYNEVGENIVNVFHAMPCRNRFLQQFEEGE
jgi:hypothetical protein